METIKEEEAFQHVAVAEDEDSPLDEAVVPGHWGRTGLDLDPVGVTTVKT